MADESPYTNALQSALGRAPNVGELAGLRRLQETGAARKGGSVGASAEEAYWIENFRQVGTVRQTCG